MPTNSATLGQKFAMARSAIAVGAGVACATLGDRYVPVREAAQIENCTVDGSLTLALEVTQHRPRLDIERGQDHGRSWMCCSARHGAGLFLDCWESGPS